MKRHQSRYRPIRQTGIHFDGPVPQEALKSLTFVMGLVFLLGAFYPVYAEDFSTNSPEAIIQSLYNSHQPWNKKEIDLGNKNSLANHFEKDIVNLFLEESKCVRKTKEICKLDFDPIFDAQDFEASNPNLKIKKISSSSSATSYEVTFTNIDTLTLTYKLIKTKNGWRISDILYPDGRSLKKILSEKTQ